MGRFHTAIPSHDELLQLSALFQAFISIENINGENFHTFSNNVANYAYTTREQLCSTRRWFCYTLFNRVIVCNKDDLYTNITF
ncbi:hypothetical protein FRX31_021168 [Thalictrum thalictroides]|uniref:Uncharacterized protein n=1 Tax=Thalictrum thalictroides TaxID=46969 RepID=A0A7J6VVW8_THATH|nr:hypothetical protein FRX31_021168 [Thalictrum thalictroides]